MPRDESNAPMFTGRWRVLLFLWIGLLAVQMFFLVATSVEPIAYSTFKEQLAEGAVASVVVGEHDIRGKYKEPVNGETNFRTHRVEDEGLLGQLQEQGVEVAGAAPSSPWSGVISWLFPILVILVAVNWLVRRNAGAGGSAGFATFGRSKARLYRETDINVTFDDVAGVDEAKGELREVIEFLRHPERFQRLGGKLPKGILLVGPPGTGKTLLARAVAGEAAVPFYSMSGSEFVEMFVGVGAARVRDLFNEAKKKAPCIVFIDELDALGKARGIGPTTHEEREQTLNQLLVELDGFDAHAGVVLMAATNRPEILDPALLRAGRFDRQVLVDRPDKIGRLAILKVHARGVALAEEVDLESIAAMTAGFAGADLANLVNEAALLAARRGSDSVGDGDLQEALERIVAGLEKKNRVLSAAEKRRVAHHEVGHALVALSLPGTDPVRKVSIIPRGIAALGYTLQTPTADRFLLTQSELEDRMAVLLGGRVAEELVFGEVSTGAEDDLRKASELARSMVETYGMSDAIGLLSVSRGAAGYLQPTSEPRSSELSDQTAREIDCAIRATLDRQHVRVKALLTERRTGLESAAHALLERETLSGDELAALLGIEGADETGAHKTPAASREMHVVQG